MTKEGFQETATSQDREMIKNANMFFLINSAPQRLVEYIVSTMGFAISVAVIYTNTTIYYIDVIYLSLHHYRRHDDVIKWKHFLRYWLFVQGIHRWIPHIKASDAELWCFL